MAFSHDTSVAKCRSRSELIYNRGLLAAGSKELYVSGDGFDDTIMLTPRLWNPRPNVPNNCRRRAAPAGRKAAAADRSLAGLCDQSRVVSVRPSQLGASPPPMECRAFANRPPPRLPAPTPVRADPALTPGRPRGRRNGLAAGLGPR